MENTENNIIGEIDRVLEEALELTEKKRIAYLASIRKGCPDVYAEVEEILKKASSFSEFLEGHVLDIASSLLQEIIDEESSVRIPGINKYDIEEEIGRGGMGVVYKARHVKINRIVAIKVMRESLMASQLRERFEQEQQVLSKLEHPNIARLYEVGLTEDQRPYFVMEYVDGLTLTKYCDENSLSIDDRLRKFVSVAESIRFVEQKLIIHRDIKPSNIFVSRDGEIKLLDFGIAKILSVNEGESEPTDQLMTPKYAAPEQIEEGSITTATNVYQLGVLLYELLTGGFPYPTNGLSYLSICQNICHREPERPSLVVKLSGGEGNRSINGGSGILEKIYRPDRLSQKLKGDLDAIILRAIRKEPEARYSSAGDISADVKRYLAGWPVEAIKGDLSYRMSKFASRNRVNLSVLTVISAFIVFMLLQQIWLAREEGRRAQEEARASALSLVINGLDNVQYEQWLSPDVTAPAIVTDLQKMVERLQGEPLMQASAMLEIAEGKNNLGLYTEASTSLYIKALDIQKKELGESHSEAVETLLRLGVSLMQNSRYKEALPILQKVYEFRRASLNHSDSRVLETLNAIAFWHASQGNREKSDSLFQIVLSKRNSPKFNGYTEIAQGLEGLATNSIMWDQNSDFDYVGLLLREASELRLEETGDNLKTGRSFYTLAAIMEWSGFQQEALEFSREALKIHRQYVNENHIWIADCLILEANILIGMERYDEAEQLYGEAIRLNILAYERVQSKLASSWKGLEMIFLKTDNVSEAEDVFTKGISHYQQHEKDGSTPDYADDYISRLGRVLIGLSQMYDNQEMPIWADIYAMWLSYTFHSEISDSQNK